MATEVKAESGGGVGPLTTELQALIDYYSMQGYYGHVQLACLNAMSSNNDPKIRFWRAFAMAQLGNHSDAIRELEALHSQSELSLACTAALMASHKEAQIKDKDALSRYKEQLKQLSKSSSESGMIFAARYFWLAGKAKQAKQCIDTVVDKNRRHIEALSVLSWVYLSSGSESYVRKSVTFFDAAVKLSDKKDIGALMGRAHYYERKKKFDRAVEDLNHVLVLYPAFLPALVVKAQIMSYMNNWEEAIGLTHKVFRKDPMDLDCLRLMVLYLLARECKTAAAVVRLQELIEAIDASEAGNSQVMFDVAQLCARLANRKPAILQSTMYLLDKACKIDPMNSVYVTEKAYQMTLLGDINTARALYDEASKLDEGNMQALHGRIKCEIMSGEYREAEAQLEFLRDTSTQNAQLLFLSALVAWHQEHDEVRLLQVLNDAVEAHSDSLGDRRPGADHLIAFNPDFMLELIGEIMAHVGAEPKSQSDPPNPLLDRAIQLLQQLTNLVPGMLEAQLLMAKACFVAGDFEQAESALGKCIQLEPQFAPAYMLQAQIYLAREKYTECNMALEQARSLDFEVRSAPVFYLMKARLFDVSGQSDEALKVLETAMNMPGVRREHAKKPLAPADRIALFLELATLHAKAGHLPEAAKVMQDAKHEFSKSAEAVRIILVDADLAVRRRDVESAIGMLNAVPMDSVYHTRAMIKLSEIYLKQKKNKKMYADCYQQLAIQGNTVHSYVLLGEAYMKIQEPEKAIAAFEQALSLSPTDSSLSIRIGRALVTTHDYARAVKYYDSATKADASKVYLLHELAELHLQLQNFDAAVRVLSGALAPSEEKNGLVQLDEVKQLSYDVKSYMLLAQVYRGASEIENVRVALENALNLQAQILDKMGARSMSADAKREQRELAAQICTLLAEHWLQVKQKDKAKEYYSEALKHHDSDEKARSALARMHLLAGDLEQCQHQCMFLLRFDPGNKEASMMLADVMFRKGEHDAATFHFQQLLDHNPERYEAMSKQLQLLRRAGRLSDAPRLIKAAEKASAKAKFAPGLHYCKGLHAWYTNDPFTALKEFNQARKDGEWGRDALMAMIEIYLNPDNSDLFQDAAEAKGDSLEYVRHAQSLIQELRAIGEEGWRVQVLDAYALMLTKQKLNLEKAITILTSILDNDRDNVPARLALANAFMFMNQQPKARNQLKIIAKHPLNGDFASEFERAWLMLADMYIASGKFDMASELCKKTLMNNKSSAKAWEHLGLIMMKEEAYSDAAEKYEQAWIFMNESSPSVGYKLALTYLKAKRYVEAIEVCHKVLKQQPEYPKIRKDILDKARASIRP